MNNDTLNLPMGMIVMDTEGTNTPELSLVNKL